MNAIFNKRVIFKILIFSLGILLFMSANTHSNIILSVLFSVFIILMYLFSIIKLEKHRHLSSGMRENATILFVDIRNFTQISEKMEPQEVSLILNEYFSVIEPIINRYNGVINKYMGDGLLAVFSKNMPLNEQALNAIKCGTDILEEVKILKEKLLKEGKPLINVGMGINTGEVFAGNIGTLNHSEYTVIGDNVNLAFRIESFNHTLKTQFLISEYTYEYVKDFVDVVKLSQVNIKGKSKPIDIYEILRIKNNDR